MKIHIAYFNFTRRTFILLALLFAMIVATATTQLERIKSISGLATPDTSEVIVPLGAVGCFDFYHFGSVQAKLSAPVLSAASGTAISFSGVIANSNPYPIVDGALYIKVLRSRGSSKDANGPDIVDQYLVKGDVVIPANGDIPVTFTWRVPAYAQAGDYKIATYFTASRKFNLLGLSFTDDVVGNTVPFSVFSEAVAGVQIEKNSVTVNGAPYRFAAFPPRVNKTKPVRVHANVVNSTDAPQQARVSWRVYQWDAQLAENIVQEVDAPFALSVPAHGSTPISIDITDTKYPVYLAVAVATWEDTKSVIGVRFVRDGVDRPRINFPGVSAFPLEEGRPVTLFSCLHNSGSSPTVPDGRFEMTLSDSDGKEIHTFNYKGSISSAMMGVADTFTPARSYDRFTLNARLYQGDTFIDEAHLDYDCDSISPGSCTPTESKGGRRLIAPRDIVLFALVFVAAVVLIIITFFVRRERRS